MARKRLIPATVSRSYILLPLRQPTAEELGAGTPPSLAGAWRIETANGVLVEPPNTNVIERAIKQSNFNKNDLFEKLSTIVINYCIDRCAENNAITLNDTYDYCQDIHNAFKNMLSLLNKNSASAVHARQLISETVLYEKSRINWDAFYPIVSLATAKSSKLLLDRAAVISAASPPEGTAWLRLVCQCADFFVIAGANPTASKSSRAKNPRPSRFVAFIHTLMSEAVPPPYREYIHSVDGLTKEISTALRVWRSTPAGSAAGQKR